MFFNFCHQYNSHKRELKSIHHLLAWFSDLGHVSSQHFVSLSDQFWIFFFLSVFSLSYFHHCSFPERRQQVVQSVLGIDAPQFGYKVKSSPQLVLRQWPLDLQRLFRILSLRSFQVSRRPNRWLSQKWFGFLSVSLIFHCHAWKHTSAVYSHNLPRWLETYSSSADILKTEDLSYNF